MSVCLCISAVVDALGSMEDGDRKKRKKKSRRADTDTDIFLTLL